MPKSGVHTVYERLHALYDLQQIDSQLDELNETHGELPHEAVELRLRFQELKQAIETQTLLAQESAQKKNACAAEIADLLDKEKKYRNQQYNVKTNRQYDALVREIEALEKRVVDLRNALKQFEEQEAKAAEHAAALQTDFTRQEEELNLKEMELEESRQTTNAEETALIERRKNALANVSSEDRATYARIRRARGGRAIALVRRNSCSGCFNVITPQKLVEMNRYAAMLICENCGRLLVPEDFTAHQQS